ncbi:GIY-YIG nuclease family protein [Pseudohongiella nitratireducens]|uniref:GIY-YIG nuclease family protein n=1 Tax=Pseudohongiella nitratireducens TaxID=1768907 RepID=UPI0030ECC79B|tara:strand:- start:9060 stop:9386 length:327 start_codon:yes stop_codon:yes gene_type:complete
MDEKGSEAAALWWLYVIQCGDGSLYTGVSTDVQRRFSEHQQQGAKTARYLRGRGPLRLVFSIEAGNRGNALKMEYRVKQLSRSEKLTMISNRKLPASLVTTAVTEITK